MSASAIPSTPSGRLIRAPIIAALLALAAFLLAACGGQEEPGEPSSSQVADGGHIHAVAIDPGDGALLIATHEGLFRVPPEARRATRVGPVQDLMGFTVAGSDRFYASGHPGPEQEGPDHLGLIVSDDGGGSWAEVSLAGRADFHALEYADGEIVGYNGVTGQVMTSSNGGGSWAGEAAPAPILDIAIDPADARHLIATSEVGLIERTRSGEWRPISDRIGLLAWPRNGPLYIVEGDGRVFASRDAGASWRSRGALPGAPAAFTASGPAELYAALGDGEVVASTDGGSSWASRLGS